MKRKNKDFTDELAEMLPPERVERAKKKAEKEIYLGNLGMGIEIKAYSKDKGLKRKKEFVLLKA
ncbi:MAG: hypothetical protein NT166_11685 [Candidatus Aminicenantes bacterium]|nr:hypothetical protein [Candidatus Aminicenantes bacterium]